MTRKHLYLAGAAVLAALGGAGCIDSYVPEVAPNSASLLVVDGFINGNGRTRIHLSRTATLDTKTNPPVERGARVSISDGTTQYALTERSPGFYLSDSLQLTPGRRYYLRLTTAAGAGRTAASYESNPVPMLATPPIDALRFGVVGEDVHIRVDAHDDDQQSRYYRWQFTETWEFTSKFLSELVFNTVNKDFETRPTSQLIYRCWRTEVPSDIAQASTAGLTRNLIVNRDIRTFSTRAERTRIRYSVLVAQIAETPAEYAYYELLRKNTEAVGGVNDPLPTPLTGNVRRVSGGNNADEAVLGFVAAHTVQYHRLFINNRDLNLPADWRYDSPYSDCSLGCLSYADAVNVFSVSSNIPLYFGEDPRDGTIGFCGSVATCVDCRLRGAISPPSFW